jgi:hypothetical protein
MAEILTVDFFLLFSDRVRNRYWAISVYILPP